MCHVTSWKTLFSIIDKNGKDLRGPFKKYRFLLPFVSTIFLPRYFSKNSREVLNSFHFLNSIFGKQNMFESSRYTRKLAWEDGVYCYNIMEGILKS